MKIKSKSITRRLVASAATLAMGVSLLPMTVAQAEELTLDGSSSERAAASCYEIKKNNPSAKSGSYWLYTPQMDAPAQFYCDQETDGGGWVMIGRGREGWTEEYAGKGRAADMASNPDGTDAFSPIQLPSQTVDALVNGQTISELEDGVRFRRAADEAGSTWQEVRAHRGQVKNWSWALQAYANWNNISFQNPRGFGLSNTYRSSLDRLGNFNSGANAILFTATKEQSWKLGFSYGFFKAGSNSPTTHLWSQHRNNPIAFTQVYVRPKLTQENVNFTAVPTSGAAASAKRQLPNNYSAAMQWRTSEQSGTGNDANEMNTRVQAITQVGDTVFTGGDFKNLVSRTGETVNQAFLAGYNVKSADLVRSFTPTFNGQIKALEALPSGKLAVGGEFSKVNNEDVAGFVILDPVTGQIDRSLDVLVQNRTARGSTFVRSLQVQNGYLYLAGSFTHVKGNTSDSFAYSRNAARISLQNGAVDWNWRPNFNGTVNGISAAEDGGAVYAAGYFSTLNGQRSWKLASIDPVNGGMKQTWDWKLSWTWIETKNSEGFQFDVQATDSKVWAAGAEHLIAQYNRSDLSRNNSAITKSGGDFQDLYRNGSVVYGACHCGDWIYDGGESHDNPWDETHNIEMIRLVAAFDGESGEVLPEFNPILSGKNGHGIWESFVDSQGVLWVGGDIIKSVGANGAQNTVGFARYTPRDVTPAGVPKNLKVSTADGQDKLTWASGGGKSSYQILRNNKVIATVSGTSYSVAHTSSTNYFVRSVDSAGNYSASTAAVVSDNSPTNTNPANQAVDPAQPAADPADAKQPAQPGNNAGQTDPNQPAQPAQAQQKEIIAKGSEWSYLLNGWTAGSTWKDVETQAKGWSKATAPMGWYTEGLSSVLNDTPVWQPTSMYLRKDVTIDNPAAYSKLVINMRSDDGSVLYLNGKEINKDNMPRLVTALTFASQARSDADAINKPLVIEIPASQLQAGKNTIAVSVHGKSTLRSGVSFDLSATLQ